MRPRQPAAVQLARPLGRVFPEPLQRRFGVAQRGSIIHEMLEAEEAQRRLRNTFGAAVTDAARPARAAPQSSSRPAPQPSPPTPLSGPAAAAAGQPDERKLPPKLPVDQKLCERAVMLLSTWQRGIVLTKDKRAELAQIIGVLPDEVATAHRWKCALKALRPSLPNG